MKTSLAPGSRVVTNYLESAGLMDGLESLGFHTVGYGCTMHRQFLVHFRIQFEMPSIQTISWPAPFSLGTGTLKVASVLIFGPTGSPHRHWWSRTPWLERLTSI